VTEKDFVVSAVAVLEIFQNLVRPKNDAAENLAQVKIIVLFCSIAPVYPLEFVYLLSELILSLFLTNH